MSPEGTIRKVWIQVLVVVLLLLLVPTASLVWLLPSPTSPSNAPGAEKPRGPQGSSALSVEPPPRPGAPTAPTKRPQSLHGQVVDGDGKGVIGATVRCVAADEPLSVNTAEDGRFELPLRADGCAARASHPDYGVSDSARLAGAGANRLALPSPGGISGFVVDDRGLPVPTYLIAVESFTAPGRQPDSPEGVHKFITDPSGAFELLRLARGRYTLTASAEGRPPTRSDAVEVEPGRPTRGVRIKLVRGILLSGIVTDKETTKPLSGVAITLDGLSSSSAHAIEHGTSSADGEDGAYSLDGVPAGPFSVRFSRAGYRDRIMSFDGTGKSEVKGNAVLGLAASGGSIELSNVGAMLGQSEDHVTVGFLIPDGPAEKAGVHLNDRLLSIDGKGVDGLTMNDCVQKLRGPEGSRVSIVVHRGGKTLEFDLTRALVVR